ncbi:MAG: ATP-binding protein [Candidatus Methanogaster sp.]|uniref:ATP-binding protein n=1 Tax=Candidatus Methanogaster sp. TaxID=3386292 RepID=A0AC61L785_9EURY|nr:MAG: ATP-binding protein [ANME-2 cluster archaeon]
MEFHNREKETKEIMAILDSEPSLIMFVYGPINSGKTTLITHLIEELPDEYVVFYVNLRGKFISNYDNFVRALFKLDREKKEYKEILKTISEVSLKSLKFTGIPVTEGVMDLFFREKTYEDVFEFLEDYFTEIAENKIPVLIVDELQKIGDVRINTYLVYELFNLFVRLTKELHLCHVFAVTSDSLFVERVYSEAMLSGRCDYLLVDDFDENATAAFLEEHGFTDDEMKVAWECCGGKPVCLLELIRADDPERKIAKLLRLRTGELKTFLKTLNELGGKITVNDERHEINYELIIDVLKMFLDEEEIDMWSIDEISKRYLVKNNILFIDPDMGIIKPQSRLDLLAIREVMGDAYQLWKPKKTAAATRLSSKSQSRSMTV